MVVLTCLYDERRLTYTKVSCLKTSLFSLHIVISRARNRPEKFRGFRETYARSKNTGKILK